MDRQLAGFIALGIVLGLAAQLSAGQIRLYMAPSSWHHVTKVKEPGRFWAFIIAEGVLLVAVLAQGLLASV